MLFFNEDLFRLSTLDRYKEIYKIVENLDFPNREKIKLIAQNNLERINKTPQSDDTKKYLFYCLKFQYLARYKYSPIFGDSEPYGSKYEKNEFEKNVSEIIGRKNWKTYEIVELDKKYGKRYVDELIRESHTLDAKFNSAMSNESDFFLIIPNLIWGNPNGYIFHKVFDFVTNEMNSLFFPAVNVDFYSWKELTDKRLNQTWWYKSKADDERESWFPSMERINLLDQKYQKHIAELNSFYVEVFSIYDDVQISYHNLKKSHEEYLKSFYYSEQIEVIEAVNEGTKLKHFLLEKMYL